MNVEVKAPGGVTFTLRLRHILGLGAAMIIALVLVFGSGDSSGYWDGITANPCDCGSEGR